jgi:hypothetical protein
MKKNKNLMNIMFIIYVKEDELHFCVSFYRPMKTYEWKKKFHKNSSSANIITKAIQISHQLLHEFLVNQIEEK